MRPGCDWRTGIETLLLLFDLRYWQLAVHDPGGRFFCSTTLSEKNFIKDLHDYADSSTAEFRTTILPRFTGVTVICGRILRD